MISAQKCRTNLHLRLAIQIIYSLSNGLCHRNITAASSDGRSDVIRLSLQSNAEPSLRKSNALRDSLADAVSRLKDHTDERGDWKSLGDYQFRFTETSPSHPSRRRTRGLLEGAASGLLHNQAYVEIHEAQPQASPDPKPRPEFVRPDPRRVEDV